MSRTTPVVSLVALLVAVAPAAAQKQEVDYVGYVAVYAPLNSVIKNQPPSNITFTQQAALALGMRGTLWVEKALAFEGVFNWAFSDVEVTSDEMPGVQTENAHVWIASGRVLYRPFRSEGSFLFHVGGGLSIIGHGGDAYTSITGTTFIGGTLGVGMSIALGRGFAIRIEAEDYIYFASFNPNLALETSTRLQNDLVFSAGLAVPIVN